MCPDGKTYNIGFIAGFIMGGMIVYVLTPYHRVCINKVAIDEAN